MERYHLRNPNGKAGPKVWIGTLMDDGSIKIEFGSASAKSLKKTIVPKGSLEELVRRARQKIAEGYETIEAPVTWLPPGVYLGLTEAATIEWLLAAIDAIVNELGLLRVDRRNVRDADSADGISVDRMAVTGTARTQGGKIEALLASIALKASSGVTFVDPDTHEELLPLAIVLRAPNELRAKLAKLGLPVPVDHLEPTSMTKPRFELAW